MSKIVEYLKKYDLQSIRDQFNTDLPDLVEIQGLIWYTARLREHNSLSELLKAPEAGDPLLQTAICCAKAYQAWQQGNVQEGMREIAKAESLEQATDRNYWLGIIKNISGLLYFSDIKIESAIHCFEEALDLRKVTEDYFGLGDTFYNLGDLYSFIGDFERSDKYIQECIIKYRGIDNQIGLILPLILMAENYRIQGNLTEASHWIDKTLNQIKIAENLHPTPPFRAYSYHRVGRFYHQSSEFEKAREYYEKALTLRKKGTPAEIIESLADLVQLYFDDPHTDQSTIETSVHRMKKLQTDSRSTLIDREITLGLIEKNQKSIASIAKSLTIFQNLLKEEKLGFSQQSRIILNYIELKLLEAKLIDSFENMGEIESMLEILDKLAINHNIQYLRVEIAILFGKICTIENNYNRAMDHLKFAHHHAQKYQLRFYIDKAQSELQLLSDLLLKIERKISFIGSVSQQIDEVKILTYLDEVNKLLTR